MTNMHEKSVDYQVMLRGIGAYLDRHAASYIAVMEMPDGFSVRYTPSHNLPQTTLVRFMYEELEALIADLEFRRDLDGDGKRVVDAYQNFLRALGWQLGRSKAGGILVEELEDRVMITYVHPDPGGANIFLKSMVFMGSAEREALLKIAVGRRENGAPRGPIQPPVLRPSMAPPEEFWEMGERVLYRTEVKDSSTARRRHQGRSGLVLTSRRILLRSADVADRTLLTAVTNVVSEVGRDRLKRVYRVEVRRDGGDRVELACEDEEQMHEVATRVREAVSRVRP